MNFTLGLVSVSFRGLTPIEIVRISNGAGLSAIEWGGDVHVPAGRVSLARDVREMTLGEGLSIPEYGSYYRLGASAPEEIGGVAECARALGTDTVRVWAYNKGSREVSEEEYRRAVSDAKRICALYPDLTFCTECHNNTLTDDYNANLRLLADVDMPNFAAFWQPNQFKSHEYNLRSLCALSPFVRAVHVFAWEGNEHYPLLRHLERWREYLDLLPRDGRVSLMLEFMHDGSPDSLPETAETLRRIVELSEC